MDDKTFNRLSEEFNIIEEKVTRVDNETKDIVLTTDDYEVEEISEKDLQVMNKDSGKIELFDLIDLKKDFVLARRNLQNLVRRGRDLFNSLSTGDADVMSGSRIEGISNLMANITKTIETTMVMYERVVKVERERNNLPDQPGMNIGKANTVNIIQGTTADLLKKARG